MSNECHGTISLTELINLRFPSLFSVFDFVFLCHAGLGLTNEFNFFLFLFTLRNDPRLEGLLQNAVRRTLQDMGRRCVQELEKQARPGT